MATTTTNFGWDIPQSTDLVKDGATAIAALGQDIDTAFVDLKGGTTGQILAKASNTDLDYTWVTNDVGDITEITASSPLTGGGTSGAVTIGILNGTTSNLGAVQLSDSTSSTSTTLAATANAVKTTYDLANAAIPKSLIDAAGDLIVGTAADTVGRIAIGTTGQVLTSNGTTATWATPASSAFSGASVYKTSGTQNINNGTWTIITFNAEYFDTDSYHNNSTNTGRLTIPATGYYRVDGQVAWSQSSAGIRHHRLRKNDTDDIVYRVAGCDTKSDQEFSYELSYLAYLTSGDYLTFECYQDSGGTLTVSDNPNRTNFTIEKVG
jgi:hypothetical protein